MRLQRAFTLLEVLLAIAITATIGVASHQLLSGTLLTKEVSDRKADQLKSLQRLNQVLNRDIRQIIDRPIRDVFGDEQPPLLLESSDYPLEFTRAGWRNSPVTEDPRAELQRVAYRLEPIDSDICESARERLFRWGITEPDGDCLVRYYWHVLDRANDTEPSHQVVYELVERLEMEVLISQSSEAIGDSQDWYSSWPALTGADNRAAPVALRWRIELPPFGEIERLWLLAPGDLP
ncbi:type II secretion system protein GspJ [Bacterioplanes sanyensis]|uniref:type II secretion system minor pseudopilin GspJ n=1 Tax=Bacterioplanes sanyensis TaxID=1249553 RepID=UPI0016752806|nr:type II secretion system minor pseudopilin GspJ [Bacterioplanes sanyensis]GGY41571.1 type II secretion system protein GspJ [Bacterioplanes sanyensis]